MPLPLLAKQKVSLHLDHGRLLIFPHAEESEGLDELPDFTSVEQGEG